MNCVNKFHIKPSTSIFYSHQHSQSASQLQCLILAMTMLVMTAAQPTSEPSAITVPMGNVN